MFDFLKMVWALLDGRKAAIGMTLTLLTDLFTRLPEVIAAWDATPNVAVLTLIGEILGALGFLHKILKGV